MPQTVLIPGTEQTITVPDNLTPAQRSQYLQYYRAVWQQKRAIDRQRYLKPRDPAFEQKVADYTNQYLANENDSIPYQQYQKALAAPIYTANRAINPALSEIGKVAILRKVREENGTGLIGQAAVANSLNEMGVPYARGISPRGKPTILPDTGGKTLGQYQTDNELRANQQINDLLRQRQQASSTLADYPGSNFPNAFQPSLYRDGGEVSERIRKAQEQLNRTNTLLSQYGAQDMTPEDPVRPFVRALLRKAAERVAPSVIATNPDRDKRYAQMSPSQLSSTLLPGSWQNALIPGYDDTIAKMPGLAGVAARMATGFVQPESLVTMAALGSLGTLSDVLGSSAVSLESQLPTAEASLAPQIAARAQTLRNAANATRGMSGLIGRGFQAQGLAGALQSAGNFRSQDPWGSYGDIAANLGLAALPEVHVPPASALASLLDRINSLGAQTGREVALPSSQQSISTGRFAVRPGTTPVGKSAADTAAIQQSPLLSRILARLGNRAVTAQTQGENAPTSPPNPVDLHNNAYPFGQSSGPAGPSDPDDDIYLILEGVHRTRAAHEVGDTEIPAQVDNGPVQNLPISSLRSPKSRVDDRKWGPALRLAQRRNGSPLDPQYHINVTKPGARGGIPVKDVEIPDADPFAAFR